jgi:type IV pilus assembly protein PilV
MHPARFRQRIPRKIDRQFGGVLIEALVSILILSFGLLGMAGLQINSLSFQKNSWVVHRLSELTTDIAEKVRSNPLGASLGLYTYTPDYATGKAATFTLTNCTNANTSCSAASLSTDDVNAWIVKTQDSLPQGSAQLTGTVADGFVATMMWFDKESTANPSICGGSETGVAWRNCCPTSANVSSTAGVRCYRARFTP